MVIAQATPSEVYRYPWMRELKLVPSLFPQSRIMVSNLFITCLERNNSQVVNKRRIFESERKAHHKNFYHSIVRNDRSAETEVKQPIVGRSKTDPTENLVQPRWHRSLMNKFDVKRKLFQDHNKAMNYSISMNKDHEDELLDR